ncbi:MAG TPA: hypothetical protein VFB21_14755 [Chthonomonadaceae bacterium]|nr:hypothetical protein [Chthonomonadaceae bacterium]
MAGAGRRGADFRSVAARFPPAYSAYDIRLVPDVAYAAPNLVTLDHGVCLHLNEAKALEIFPSVRGASSCRLLNEPALKGAMLFKNGTQALFVRDRTVYAASLRSPS